MGTLRAYVDAMFVGFKMSDEVKEIKANILNSMGDKFQDLCDQGVSETEAIAKVIAEFGNIDELKRELEGSNQRIKSEITSLEYRDYLRFQNKRSWIMGLAIALLIASTIAPILLSEVLGTTVFMFIAALAIGLLIVVSLRNHDYQGMLTSDYVLSNEDQADFYQRLRRHKATYNALMPLAVVLIIMAVIAAYLLSEWQPDGDLSGAAFMAIVAMAVGILVQINLYRSSLNQLDPSFHLRQAKEESGHGYLFGIVMPLAAAIFIALGLAINAWSWAWFIFPVCAIVTSVVVNTLDRGKE